MAYITSYALIGEDYFHMIRQSVCYHIYVLQRTLYLLETMFLTSFQIKQLKVQPHQTHQAFQRQWNVKSNISQYASGL